MERTVEDRAKKPDLPQPTPIQAEKSTQILTAKPIKWPEKCPNCSAKVSPGVKYCPLCGFNLEAFARRSATKAPKLSYYGTKRRFFSFEGYELEGVVPAASMYLLWGFWNVIWAFLVSQGMISEVLWPAPFSDWPLSFALPAAIAAILFSAAAGLMIVNTPLYILGMMGVATMLPMSFLQIRMALLVSPEYQSAQGSPALPNILSGIIGVIICAVSLLQSIRIRKYFFGGSQ